MFILLYYIGVALLTSIVIFIFEDVYGDRTSDTESALLFGILWPITVIAMTLGWIFLILDATLKTCISIIKNKED